VRVQLALPLVAAILGGLVACATNPVTGRREVMLMSESQEIGIGQESHPQILEEMGEYDDPALQQYVNELGQRLARRSERPDLPWHFTVVDQPVVNAFAVPGGFIYITRGILSYLDNEAQLVGVLGHEIGHVTARHSAQQYTRQVSGSVGLAALGIFVPAARPLGDVTSTAVGALFLKYGRDDELQADDLGARYAATNGWDPRQVPAFLTTLGRLSEGSTRGVPNWLSTHPEPASRVKDIQPLVQQLTAAGGSFTVERDGYLRRVDGMLYGDNPEQGIVRGSTFLHPELRLQLEFPQTWEVMNSPRQVVASAPGADLVMLMEIVQQPQGRTVQEVALNSMRGAGLAPVQGDRATLNGLEAWVGVYRGRLQGLGNVVLRAGHISHNRQIYLVAGIAPPAAFEQVDAEFLRTIRSFRALSAAEAEAIHPNRIDLYTVRSNDTWASIAEASGGIVDAQTLAIMNDSPAGSRPEPGRRIKIVVGG